MINVMLDLETWGTRPGCDIRSIGACVFDPVAGLYHPNHYGSKSHQIFYVATDNPPIIHPGETEPKFPDDPARIYALNRDKLTVKWWSEQSAEAQDAFIDPIDLKDACIKFANWLHIFETSSPDAPNELRIWAHDPHFDVSILEAVYDAVELPVPWHYRAPRSLRTITEAAGMTRDDFAAFNHGTAHNALDDAIAQAGIVCEAFKRLNLARS